VAPWISVIIPTYDGAKYIAEALASIEGQADADVEVVVVDDGSTDETLAIVESFRGRLRLELRRLAHSGNWVHVTNAGLALATGRFGCLLHQDDFWLPGRLQALRQHTASSQEEPVVLSPAIFVDADGRNIGQWTCPLPAGRVDPATLYQTLLVQNYLAVPAPIFPLDLAREVGGFDEQLWYTADWDFWLKSAQRARAIFHHPQPLSAFRVHAESQTLARSGAAAEMADQQNTVLSRYLPLVAAENRAHVERMARTSISVNRALTMAAASNYRGWPSALTSVLRLGPLGISRYLVRSRVVERASARLRARLRVSSGRNR
jgi:hypothetical protein